MAVPLLMVSEPRVLVTASVVCRKLSVELPPLMISAESLEPLKVPVPEMLPFVVSELSFRLIEPAIMLTVPAIDLLLFRTRAGEPVPAR
jgi:hypothetical protein